MFFYQIQVDRVTEAEIASARKVIPSLEVHSVTILEDAYRVAFEKAGPKLETSEYLPP